MKHLRNRVLIQVLIPTLAIYVLLSTVGFLIYKDNYRNSRIEQKQVEFLNVSRVLSDWISSRIRELMLIASEEDLFALGSSDERLTVELNKQGNPFTDLWYIGTDGSYWNTANREGSILEIEDLDILAGGDKLFLYFVPENYGLYAMEPFILFGVPVVHDGVVTAIVGGSVKTTELNWILSLYTHRMFDSVSLIEIDFTKNNIIDGTIIVHSNPLLNGENELSVYGDVYFSNRYLKTENYFVTSLINNWMFIGQIHSANLFYQLSAFTRFFILITVLIILVISALAIGISSLISHPIISLTQMVNRMLLGDFNNTVSVRTNDELKSLANAFNQLNKHNIQLRTDDRFSFLGRISSRMAHEIRHPLHVIQIAAQTMSDKNYIKNIEIIQQEIQKADLFIREILGIAKPNELSLKLYSMNKLLKDIYSKYGLMEEEKRVTIKLALHAVYDTFYFDVLKMEQVIVNILNNSFDVVPEGGTVMLSTANDSERKLSLVIADTGPGFPPEHLDRVFDPYFTTRQGGIGLGLSICYQILTAHGAQIELLNSPQGGAITRILFNSKTNSPN